MSMKQENVYILAERVDNVYIGRNYYCLRP